MGSRILPCNESLDTRPEAQAEEQSTQAQMYTRVKSRYTKHSRKFSKYPNKWRAFREGTVTSCSYFVHVPSTLRCSVDDSFLWTCILSLWRGPLMTSFKCYKPRQNSQGCQEKSSEKTTWLSGPQSGDGLPFCLFFSGSHFSHMTVILLLPTLCFHLRHSYGQPVLMGFVWWSFLLS